MTYAVNWISRVITIPASDMVLLSGNDYQLDADAFWREIRRLEWLASEGLWALNILKHNNTRTIAGTTYVPENEIVNGYTVTFDTAAEKVFLRGDNNNIIDVLNYNGVSVIPSNSGGNTVTTVNTGSGVTAQDIADISSAVWSRVLEQSTAEEMMRIMLAALAGSRQGVGTNAEQYLSEDGSKPRVTLTPDDDFGNGSTATDGTV